MNTCIIIIIIIMSDSSKESMDYCQELNRWSSQGLLIGTLAQVMPSEDWNC